MKRKQSIEQVRWDLALRYRLIERCLVGRPADHGAPDAELWHQPPAGV